MMKRRIGLSSDKVLVIDQNIYWTEWAAQVLLKGGHEVQVVGSLESAVDLLNRESYNLVLIGADVAKERMTLIRELASRPHDPIRFLVLYPVRASYSVLRLLWRAGVSEIQPKPYNNKELLEMVASELVIEERGDRPSNNNLMMAAPVGCP
jgi:DNA-binding response OmpR family regulator